MAQRAPGGLLGAVHHLVQPGQEEGLPSELPGDVVRRYICHRSEPCTAPSPAPQESLPFLSKEHKEHPQSNHAASQGLVSPNTSHLTLPRREEALLTQMCEKVGTQMNKDLRVVL